MGFFSKLFDPSAGEIKRLNKIVDKIDSFEEAHKALTDEQLRGKTVEFRERLKNGETLDDLLPEAYSVVREATYRVTGKRQFRVQMLGGIVLHQGRIAEMKTGEGKTLVAIVNLPPRKMMGQESQGMLLSAVHKENDEERLNLVMLNDTIPAGAKLC